LVKNYCFYFKILKHNKSATDIRFIDILLIKYSKTLKKSSWHLIKGKKVELFVDHKYNDLRVICDFLIRIQCGLSLLLLSLLILYWKHIIWIRSKNASDTIEYLSTPPLGPHLVSKD